MTADTMQAEPIQPESSAPMTNNTLRLWPGIAIVAIMWLVRGLTDLGERTPSKFMVGQVFGPPIAIALLFLWWLFASRLRWFDRLLLVVAFVAIAASTVFISGKDFPAMALIVYGLPIVATAWVGWLLISLKLPWPIRQAGLVLVLAWVGAYFSCLRIEGVTGGFQAKITWRWIPSSETKLLSELNGSKPQTLSDDGTMTAAAMVLQDGDWPCFRGPQRDSRLLGVHIKSDWAASPPKELWRHRIGPGWSSCSVVGNRLYTQEQRGEDEFVVCYDTETGREVWGHHDQTRFEEMVAGAGPRGTPTFHDGLIFAMGANGNLNCLDAATGKLIWTADIVKTSGVKKVPMWGFSSSPLVSQGLVSVYAGGPESKCVVAYRADSGEFAWAAGDGPTSYCSPQSATLGGVEQVLLSTSNGLTSYEPHSGTILWDHPWVSQQARVVQPAILSDTDLLLGTGMDGGTRRLTITQVDGKWDIKEKWTTKTIKPYYNDLVVFGDYLYGFDNNIFMAVSLADGKMKWRARGYGNGQVLLIVDDALLMILTEQGEVALVEAKPDKHTEVAKFKAIEGKTWNHPVVAHGKLFVRNAEEIACFELPMADSK